MPPLMFAHYQVAAKNKGLKLEKDHRGFVITDADGKLHICDTTSDMVRLIALY